MSEIVLQTKNLCYTYPDGTRALDDVNVTIKRGQTTAILGGNGAGKTTLFTNLNGVLRPASGQVTYNDQPVQYSRKGLNALRQGVGLVFQDPDHQLFSASVYQDVSFGPMNLKLPEEIVRQRVEDCLRRTGILHLKDRPTHSLSFGQKKRVAIAGVLAMEPEVLILDEPTAGLDPKGVGEILKLLKEMQENQGISVIIATHDVDIVPLYCDYTYVLAQGKIILEGTPQNIFRESEILRKHNLRLPRIAHLMEILEKNDGYVQDEYASTISQARSVINKWTKNQGRPKAKLRSGFTTGVCAAASAKAAVCMLLTQEIHEAVHMKLPRGDMIDLTLIDPCLNAESASCAVQKDSGDDPDITNGILVYAQVAKAKHGLITIDGGKGVGRVTKPGLACQVGEAAINPVPKEMIRSEVENVCKLHGYSEGLDVVISIPAGKEIAKKTFNPRLGVLGGISILGTTGIVEPMSEKAWTDSLYIEMKQQMALGYRDLLLCPGNYGQKFIKESLGVDVQRSVKCSNFIGEALDAAVDLSFDSLLIIGHVGKLVKLGAGIMNTHSKYADARMEILGLHAAICGLPRERLLTVLTCNTTEEAIAFLEEEGILEQVLKSIMNKIDDYVQIRVRSKLKTGVIMFSNDAGVLAKTPQADELLRHHQNNWRLTQKL